MTQPVPLDPYIADVLMRDLTSHDRSPSAFLVYLWLWRKTRGDGREKIGASLQTIADQTGLSKSAVQAAVRHLTRRRLVEAEREGPTTAPVYKVLEPWRRDAAPSSRASSTQTGA